MNNLNQKLASLGVAFIEAPDAPADPEETLIEALQLFREERKLLAIILGWLALYGDLIHIARLRALAQRLNAEHLAWLGGLALHAAETDRRWDAIAQFVRKKLGEGEKTFATTKLDLTLAKNKGADPHFQKFGLTIPKIQAAGEKKFYRRNHTLANHYWLRLRVLFGSNWRADIAWQMLQDSKQTPYRISKNIGCNIETAYRNRNSLLEAQAIKLLRARPAA